MFHEWNCEDPELLSSVWTVQALDLTLAKDERLAVGFFQRAAVLMQMNRFDPSAANKRKTSQWFQKDGSQGRS